MRRQARHPGKIKPAFWLALICLALWGLRLQTPKVSAYQNDESTPSPTLESTATPPSDEPLPAFTNMTEATLMIESTETATSPESGRGWLGIFVQVWLDPNGRGLETGTAPNSNTYPGISHIPAGDGNPFALTFIVTVTNTNTPLASPTNTPTLLPPTIQPTVSATSDVKAVSAHHQSNRCERKVYLRGSYLARDLLFC